MMMSNTECEQEVFESTWMVALRNTRHEPNRPRVVQLVRYCRVQPEEGKYSVQLLKIPENTVYEEHEILITGYFDGYVY